MTNQMKKGTCVWCGESEEKHEIDYPGRPIPRVPCVGLSMNFKPQQDEKASVSEIRARAWVDDAMTNGGFSNQQAVWLYQEFIRFLPLT